VGESFIPLWTSLLVSIRPILPVQIDNAIPFDPPAMFAFLPLPPTVREPFSRIIIIDGVLTSKVSIQHFLYMSFCVADFPSTPRAMFAFFALFTLPRAFVHCTAASSSLAEYMHPRWVYYSLDLRCFALLTFLRLWRTTQMSCKGQKGRNLPATVREPFGHGRLPGFNYDSRIRMMPQILYFLCIHTIDL